MSGTRRLAACVAAWPEAEDGDYNPRCCRFPKSCSPYPYPEQIAAGNVELEPARAHPFAELAAAPAVDEPRLELANIRRLVERHGVAPADGNGELRSTIAMVEEALIDPPHRRNPP